MIHPNMESLGMIHIAFPLKNLNSYQNVEYMMLVSFQTQPLTSFLRQMNQNQEEYIQAYIEDSEGRSCSILKEGNIWEYVHQIIRRKTS